jgi:hypothetical protein
MKLFRLFLIAAVLYIFFLILISFGVMVFWNLLADWYGFRSINFWVAFAMVVLLSVVREMVCGRKK